MTTTVQAGSSKAGMKTAEAFYQLFCALSEQDRFAIVNYFLQDKEIQKLIASSWIPNDMTLNAYAEDKASMPVFETISDLRKDLLS